MERSAHLDFWSKGFVDWFEGSSLWENGCAHSNLPCCQLQEENLDEDNNNNDDEGEDNSDNEDEIDDENLVEISNDDKTDNNKNANDIDDAEPVEEDKV